MVMANYGKNTYYVIDSLLFDSSVQLYTFYNGIENVNLLKYYKEAYGIDVVFKKQPLIKAVASKLMQDQKKDIILIP